MNNLNLITNKHHINTNCGHCTKYLTYNLQTYVGHESQGQDWGTIPDQRKIKRKAMNTNRDSGWIGSFALKTAQFEQGMRIK